MAAAPFARARPASALDHNLADGAALEVAEGVGELLQREAAINGRLCRAPRSRGPCRVWSRRLPTVTRLQAQPLGLHDRERHRVDVEAADRADDRDMAAGARRDEGLAERVRAADLDHVIDAEAAGQRQRRLAPFLGLAIVDDVIGAQRLQPAPASRRSTRWRSPSRPPPWRTAARTARRRRCPAPARSRRA